MAKILFLGAAKFQLPPIEYALSKGYTVITADNVPDNPGHRIACRSYNVSTLDKERILELARKEKVDGVLTFGSDVSAMACALVAKELRLPGFSNDLAGIHILTNKKLFRQFMAGSGIQHLYFKDFHQPVYIEQIKSALDLSQLPLVVKPVDSSGSKGVSIIHRVEELEEKTFNALKESHSGSIIFENYIQKQGYQICGDGFMFDGKLAFVSFGDGHYYADRKYLAPYGETFPSTHPEPVLNKAAEKIEQCLKELGYVRGPFNHDILVTGDEEIFINEIGPRNGGNYIPTAIKLNTGVDLIAATVEAATRWDYQFSPNVTPVESFYCCYMMHTLQTGKFAGHEWGEEVRKYVFAENLYVKEGERVYPFVKANNAIGNVIFKFPSFQLMLESMKRMNAYCKVILE